MENFTLKCRCNSLNTDVVSCVRIEKNIVEIMYMCNYCCTTEHVKHFLYNSDLQEEEFEV